MALPENRSGFFDDCPLEPADLTDDILDALHSGTNEGALFAAATRGPATAMRRHIPEKYLDWNDDADLFDEVMR